MFQTPLHVIIRCIIAFLCLFSSLIDFLKYTGSSADKYTLVNYQQIKSQNPRGMAINLPPFFVNVTIFSTNQRKTKPFVHFI